MIKKYLLALLQVLTALYIQAQWEQDIRLTNEPAPSQLHKNSIASSGANIYVVWNDRRINNSEIFFKRSTNGGNSWGTDTPLTNNSEVTSYNPSVSFSGQVVHLIWEFFHDLYPVACYKRSTDAGISWGKTASLGNHHGAFSVSGQLIHHVSITPFYYPTMRYNRSTDEGQSWNNIIPTPPFNPGAMNPMVFAEGLSVHVVWYHFGASVSEISYKRSTNGGTEWNNDISIGDVVVVYDYPKPSISVSNQLVHVIWSQERNSSRTIYYKRSVDNGITWDNNVQLTSSPDSLVNYSVLASGSAVHIVWADKRDGNWEIYYKRSTDFGASWESDIRLTNNAGSSKSPSVSVSGPVVNVVWQDDRDGNEEIYYKRNLTGNLTEIKNINLEIPEQFSLFQNYPNPFNPNTNIKFQIPNEGFVKLTVFDVLGSEISTLINEELKAGTYEADWGGSNYPSGVYFYKLEAGGYTDTKKMILIK